MFNMSSIKLGPLPKVLLLLGPWGVGILLGGIIQQTNESMKADTFLLIWALVTVVGLTGQALAMCNGLERNFLVWVSLIALAWAFTFYVFRVSSDPTLFAHLGPVWLALMGVGFIFTAFQVSQWFWLLAGVHLFLALLMELAARDIYKSEFFVSNQPLLVGVVDGGLTLIAAIIGLIQYFRPARATQA